MKTVSSHNPPKNPSKIYHHLFYYFSIFAFLFLYLLIYIFHLFQPTDYDLGWHLRYGKDVITDGVIWRTNTYSTDLAGYKWVHTSWGLDIIRYLIYDHAGLIGITILGGIIVVLTFFFIARAFRFTLLESVVTLPILSLMMYAVNIHSLRGQEISFLCTAILIYLMRKYEEIVYSNISKSEIGKSKFILYFSILLFLVWTNLNGQFILGLAIFGLWTAITFLTSVIRFDRDHFKIHYPSVRFFLITLIVPAILSVLITLVNPFGIKMFEDIFSHEGSDATKFISEWAPISSSSGIVWYFLLGWGLVLLTSILVLIYRNKLVRYSPYLLASIGLYIASYIQGRYVWTMFLISSPLLAIVIGLFNPKNHKITAGIVTLILIGLSVYLWKNEMPGRELSDVTWESYCRLSNCSPTGARILAENFADKKIWTDYNYGGWLIWNYPQIKPSMDGRMPLWTDPVTHYSAFMDNYYPLETGNADPDKSQYDVFFVQNYRPAKKLLDDLVKEKKWAIVFRDNVSSIYVRMPQQPPPQQISGPSLPKKIKL